METLGFIKTATVGTKEVFTKNGKYYYWSRGRYFPIKKSVIEAGEPA